MGERERVTVTNSAPVLAPKFMFGLRTDILGNAHFISEDEILYPVGSNMVVHNYSMKRQRFIKVQDTKTVVKELIMAPNRRWLAASGISPSNTPSVTVYDMTTFKRRRCLAVPIVEELKKPKATEFACMQFSFDSKYLLAVTGEPDWWLYQFNWDKNKCESSASARAPDSNGTVDIIQCNPADATLIVVVGKYVFRIMNVQEAVWNQWGWNAADNMVITAAMWLSPDRIFFGTSEQQIMMVENGEIRPHCTFDAMTVEEMALKKSGDMEEEGKEGDAGAKLAVAVAEEEKLKYPVRFFVNFSTGFVFYCGPGYVHFFEKETPHVFNRRNVFRMCKLSYKHTREYPMWCELDEIRHMTVTPAELVLLVTTHRAQLFTVKITGPKIDEVPEINFKELGAAMHFGRINSLAMCAWKPIFMTSGEDKSIRVWNYVKEDIEMVKIYQEEIQCVSLHPNGLFAIVGFSDKLRFMVILIDDFEVMREFPVRNCKQAKFSTNGHLFAAVNGQVIQVFSSVSFQNIYNLKGHNGRIMGLSWSANDLVLTSCGIEGAVYEWGMSTGQRVGEIIVKTHQFHGCAVNGIGKLTFAAASDGEINEVANNAIHRSMKLIDGPISTITLSRSDLMLFVTGSEGTIKTLQLPISDKQNFTNEFTMHNTKITAQSLSYDDITLISVAEDASICLWQVMNPEGRAIQLDIDFGYAKEILISRKDLQEKINSINLLSTRMSELETEHNYQLRQSEASHCDLLKQIHDGYCQTIEELKGKNEIMENEHNHEIGCILQDIAKVKAGHERFLQEMEAEYNIRLISEYDRYQHLENKASRMRNEYEERIEKLCDTKRIAMRDLNYAYEAKLEDKDVCLIELQEEADLEKREHETMTTSIENDADKEIVDIKAAYTVQLKEEKDANVRLKGEIGLMKKKLITARKEIDEFKHTIHQLKAEHKQFQKVIATLEREVTDIKKDIQERDETIKDKEKRIYELKRKRSELEKYKFVLNFRIFELKNQIEPLERKIKESKQRTLELEESLETLLKARARRDEKILLLKEKMSESKKFIHAEANKCLLLKSALKKIKIDFHDMTGEFQDPVKLKQIVKELFHKWIEDIDFIRNRESDINAIREFYRQRNYLQQQIQICKVQLDKAVVISKENIYKIMDENYALLEEMNVLRAELKAARARCFQMQSILGLSARYVAPAKAHGTLDFVTEDSEKLYDKYRDQFIKKQEIVLGLKEENLRLNNKFPPLQQKSSRKNKKVTVDFIKPPKRTISEDGAASQT